MSLLVAYWSRAIALLRGMMLLALANPCVGAIVAPGGSAHGRTLRTPRASASMLDSVGPSFLLGKLDLSQVRVEREAIDSG